MRTERTNLYVREPFSDADVAMCIRVLDPAKTSSMIGEEGGGDVG